MCPQNALVRALIDHIVLEKNEVVILDMEAGLEPFSRATARSVDLLLVVMEPTLKSLDTAKKIATYARELGIGRTWGVLNKVFNDQEVADFSKLAGDFGVEIRVVIPYDPSVASAEKMGVPALDFCGDSPFVAAVERLCSTILGTIS